MRSQTTNRFRKAFEQLPADIQKRARTIYKIWKENQNHPSLHFKQVHQNEPIFSVRIGLSYRALGIKQNNDMIWFWIGSHEEYNNIIEQL